MPLRRLMGSLFPHTDASPWGLFMCQTSRWNDLPWNTQTVQLLQLNTSFLFSLSHICLHQLDNDANSAFWSYFKGSYTNIVSHYITLLQDINIKKLFQIIPYAKGKSLSNDKSIRGQTASKKLECKHLTSMCPTSAEWLQKSNRWQWCWCCQ